MKKQIIKLYYFFKSEKVAKYTVEISIYVAITIAISFIMPGDLFFTSRLDSNGNCKLSHGRSNRFGCIGHVGVVTAVHPDGAIEITHITTEGEPAYTTTIYDAYDNRYAPNAKGSAWIAGFVRPY